MSITTRDELTKDDKKRRVKLVTEGQEFAATVGLGKYVFATEKFAGGAGQPLVCTSAPVVPPLTAIAERNRDAPPSSRGNTSRPSSSHANAANSTAARPQSARKDNEAAAAAELLSQFKSHIHVLPNNGAVDDGVNSLLNCIGYDREAESRRATAFDLQTCSVQDYLQRTIFPTLYPALDMLERLRPADPVDFLAVYLYQQASTQRTRTQQLEEIHQLREKLRTQLRQEYSMQGRV